jgi:hypothetical protein
MNPYPPTQLLTVMLTVAAAPIAGQLEVMAQPCSSAPALVQVVSARPNHSHFTIRTQAAVSKLSALELQLTELRAASLPADVERPSEDAFLRAFHTAASLSTFELFPKHVLPSVEGGIALVYETSETKYVGVECLNDRSIVATVTDRNCYIKSWMVGEPDGVSAEELANHINQFLNA